MEKLKKKKERRHRIKMGIRKKIKGTSDMLRLTVFRSNKEIYAQVIDDTTGQTVAAMSSLEKDFDKKGKTKIQIAGIVGKSLAERAKIKEIEQVVFDRNGYLYHGRVKALAEGAREGGLKF